MGRLQQWSAGLLPTPPSPGAPPLLLISSGHLLSFSTIVISQEPIRHVNYLPSTGLAGSANVDPQE